MKYSLYSSLNLRCLLCPFVFVSCPLTRLKKKHPTPPVIDRMAYHHQQIYPDVMNYRRLPGASPQEHVHASGGAAVSSAPHAGPRMNSFIYPGYATYVLVVNLNLVLLHRVLYYTVHSLETRPTWLVGLLGWVLLLDK
jgi:hypothetical protein